MDLFRLVNRFNIRENLAAVKKAGAGRLSMAMGRMIHRKGRKDRKGKSGAGCSGLLVVCAAGSTMPNFSLSDGVLW